MEESNLNFILISGGLIMKKNVGEWKYYLFIAVVAAIVLSAGVYYNIVHYKDISTVLQSYPEYKCELSIVKIYIFYFMFIILLFFTVGKK